MKKTFLSFNKGFTLAEAIVVLTLMGLIAAIIIPSSISRTTEKTNKAKVRKALTTYQALIEQAVIENNLNRSVEVVDNFFRDNNCAQAHKYFKMIKTDPADSCKFMSTDKLWWDLSQGLSKTIIAQKNDAQNNWLNAATAGDSESNNAFYLVYSFDRNGAVRVNDLEFEKTSGNNFNKCSIVKQVLYINGKDYLGDEGCGAHNGGGGGLSDYCNCDTVGCCTASCPNQTCVEKVRGACENSYSGSTPYNYYGNPSYTASNTCTRNRLFDEGGNIWGVAEIYDNENGMYSNGQTLKNNSWPTFYKVDPNAKTITFAINCGGYTVCDAVFDASGNLIKMHTPYLGNCTVSGCSDSINSHIGENDENNPMKICKTTGCTYNTNTGKWEQGDPETDTYAKIQRLIIEDFVKKYGGKQ